MGCGPSQLGLFDAARRGDERGTEWRLRAMELSESIFGTKFSISINSLNETGRSVLHVAAANGQTRICKKLLARGAKVDHPSKNGDTAMHLASGAGHVDVLMCLANSGANAGLTNDDGNTALHLGVLFAQPRAVEVLLGISAASARIANQTENETPVQLAARLGRVDLCRLLIPYSGRMNNRNQRGLTALAAAASGGYTEICVLLIAGKVDSTVKDKDGNQAIALAAGAGHSGTVHVLLQSSHDKKLANKSGCNALHLAATGGHARTCQVLIGGGYKVDRCTGVSGAFSKLMATNSQETALHLATLAGSCETVKVLLDNGVNVEARRSDGKTALHLAVKAAQNTPLVHMLLKHGASPRTVSGYGWTPLHYAAKVGSTDVAVLLLRCGAFLDEKNYKGKRAADIAKEYKHVEILALLKSIVAGKPLPDIAPSMEWMPTALAVDADAEDNVSLGMRERNKSSKRE